VTYIRATRFYVAEDWPLSRKIHGWKISRVNSQWQRAPETIQGPEADMSRTFLVPLLVFADLVSHPGSFPLLSYSH
jgi:hypothetical protein